MLAPAVLGASLPCSLPLGLKAEQGLARQPICRGDAEVWCDAAIGHIEHDCHRRRLRRRIGSNDLIQSEESHFLSFVSTANSGDEYLYRQVAERFEIEQQLLGPGDAIATGPRAGIEQSSYAPTVTSETKATLRCRIGLLVTPRSRLCVAAERQIAAHD